MTLLRGVDGCRAGWLCVETRQGEEQVQVRLCRSAAELFEGAEPAVTAIDMPIGLGENGPRPCDQAARRFLRQRGSSVFPAPVRAVLAATTYAQACELSLAAQGRKLSKQSYFLLPKIRELDGLLRADPLLAAAVMEAHPEVCFARWNGDTPMLHAKKTAAGRTELLALVEGRFPDIASSVRARFLKREVADDDILDALATLHTASRLADGAAVAFGDADSRDSAGLPMRIWG
jgi:predicted RNase H-like nuclease